jgi:hypothetical protein
LINSGERRISSSQTRYRLFEGVAIPENVAERLVDGDHVRGQGVANFYRIEHYGIGLSRGTVPQVTGQFEAAAGIDYGVTTKLPGESGPRAWPILGFFPATGERR